MGNDKMRVTKHSGRVHKNGKPYSPKHNDRRFELDAGRIEKEKGNVYFTCYEGTYDAVDKDKHMSFEDVEKKYYKEHFYEQYSRTMEGYRKNRHPERIKSFDEWCSTKDRCPEEVYYQIGKVENTVDRQKFVDCISDYISWENEWNRTHGRPFQTLTSAIHADEAVPQLHSRRVWQSVDDKGVLVIGQERALAKAGIPLPKPDAKPSRYNNRKMAYDAMCREKWLDICQQHGLDVERTPLPTGTPHNQSKEQVIRRKYEERERELDAREKMLDRRESSLNTLENVLLDREIKSNTKQENARKMLLSASQSLSEAEDCLEQAQAALAEVSSPDKVIRKALESLNYKWRGQNYTGYQLYEMRLETIRKQQSDLRSDLHRRADRVAEQAKAIPRPKNDGQFEY